MTPTPDEPLNCETWPPLPGQAIAYRSASGLQTGVLQDVRWGLVWRDFILEDGRVIAEARVEGCPQPQSLRLPGEVAPGEREVCEERLATMAAAGLDPREKEQPFRAELNQYLAYTYLRFTQREPEAEGRAEDFPARIKEAKKVVTGRLSELLKAHGDARERESAAYSLGRLRDLEMALEMVGAVE